MEYKTTSLVEILYRHQFVIRYIGYHLGDLGRADRTETECLTFITGQCHHIITCTLNVCFITVKRSSSQTYHAI